MQKYVTMETGKIQHCSNFSPFEKLSEKYVNNFQIAFLSFINKYTEYFRFDTEHNSNFLVNTFS